VPDANGVGNVVAGARNGVWGGTNGEAGRPAGWVAAGRLPDGPLDLIGDIHGEVEALDGLLGHLGYDARGRHPQGRRAVFLGDLIDRGPDSLAAVRRVADLIDHGGALAVMGNHDLNAVAGRHKKENTWLFGHGPVHPWERPAAAESERREVLDFLGRLPLGLERPDLRVVHAYWDDRALASLRGAAGPREALESHYRMIKESLPESADATERNLAHQNRNPMKLITSGPEVRAAAAHFAGGKVRGESRHAWWEEYDGTPWVVFGHYWRIAVTGIQKDDGLFSRYPLHVPLGTGRAMCVDYSVGGRWFDRSQGRAAGPFTGRLAALRWPERVLVFDNGERLAVADGVAAEVTGG
jgi:hypothetical protein